MSGKRNKKLPSEYLDSRVELVESRISNFKAVISVIPYIGSAMNELLFELPNRIQQSRINDTVELLKKKIGKLEASALDTEYLESPSFFDFSRRIFEESLKIESRIKRKLLTEVYVEAIRAKENYETGRSSLFLKFIGDMAVEQIRIMNFVEKNQPLLKCIDTYQKFYDLYCGYDKGWIKGQDDFKYYCSSLEVQSLISMGAGLEDFRSKSKLLAYQGHEESSVTMTELGYAFIQHLKQ